ncbi:hypothetical protein BU25DRAFT_411793 [Macroventuria anomochaeta]|uniref:Uncharacterized protein n=1 Tax=Macroventuria anomochaeta TaxID=301207 RepID=A0ACB6RWU6_9PLEO|nr:uncharacterized protein BU25DRAFT_411793 [Macroventuria anomochaeta]KAF2626396.1 hypothetical protein BU25DRAFT_411793 [Macroventuria anomochaeta]
MGRYLNAGPLERCSYPRVARFYVYSISKQRPLAKSNCRVHTLWANRKPYLSDLTRHDKWTWSLLAALPLCWFTRNIELLSHALAHANLTLRGSLRSQPSHKKAAAAPH